MSEHVRAAHSRIRRHPRLPSDGVNARSNVDPALASPRSRLLSDLSELPEPCSTSKVFTLDEAELQIPGVRLFVRSEEQPYLRGAVNALECLIESHGLENLKSCGVVGQERSPHVEDMAIAASAYGIPVYVADLRRTDINNRHERRLSKVVLEVEQMHIDGQKAPVVANDVPVPFPLHHHAEVIHGQGTMALQLEREMVTAMTSFQQGAGGKTPKFDAVISDMGNGCMLSGICMAYSGENTQVFGAAPSSGFWEHAARLSMAETLGPEQSKSSYWNDVEIPIGDVPWSVFTSTRDLAGVFDVDDNALKAAAHKVFEHSGLHIRPDEAAPLAVVLYNQDFRSIIARRVQDGRLWTIGVLLQPRKSTLTGRVSMLGAEVSNFQPFE